MRLVSTSITNFGPLRDVEIDFSNIGQGILSISGPLGSGKTTLMTALGPAVWFQSGGGYYTDSVWDHFVGSGHIESVYDFDGQEVTFRLEAEKSGKVRRAYVKTPTEVAGPLLTPALELAAKYVASPLFTYATIFAAQGNSGSIFKLKPADRRALLIELLGLDVYEARAKLFATLQRGAKEQLAQSSEAVAAAREVVGRSANLHATIRDAQARIAEWRHQQIVLEETLTTGRQVLDSLRSLAAADAATREALDREATTWRQQITILDVELANATVAMGDDAVMDPEAMEKLGATVETLKGEIEGAQWALIPLTMELDRLSGLLLADEEQATANTAAIDQAQADSETARTRFREQRDDLGRLTNALTGVDLSVPMCQICPLTAEGQAAKQRLTEAEIAYRKLVTDLGTVINEVTERQLLLAEQIADRRRLQVEASERVAPVQTKLDDLTGALAQAQGELQGALTLAQRHQAALAAAGRVLHLSAQRRDAQAALDGVGARIAALTPPDPAAIAGAEVRVAGTGAELRALMDAIGEDERSVAGAEGQLREIGDAAAKLATAEASERRRGVEISDFGTLKTAWEQVRWALIDDACPRIEHLANDLLSGFDDGRFRIELPTATEKKSGGEKDGLVPRVIDTRADAVREQVSGGETGICDEALRGAISIYRSRRLGIKTETLFRDEPTSPLGRASAYYIQLLRRMWEMSGAYQLIVATHDQDAIAAADRRLILDDGRVRIE